MSRFGTVEKARDFHQYDARLVMDLLSYGDRVS